MDIVEIDSQALLHKDGFTKSAVKAEAELACYEAIVFSSSLFHLDSSFRCLPLL